MSPRAFVRRVLSLVLASAFALTLVVPAAHAATLESLAGDGTEESPHLIGTAADLLSAAEAINSDPGQYADRHYRLAADLDLDGVPFTGIDRLAGVLDGAGHRIANLTYAPGGPDGTYGLVHLLDGGTVRDLTLDGVTAHTEDAVRVAGIAVEATGGAVLDGNSVVNADLSTQQQYVAALVNNAHDGVTVTNNWTHGEFTSERYPSVVVGYGRYDLDISRNLVQAVVTATGNQAVGAMVHSYAGGYSREGAETYIRENVLLDGAIGWLDGRDRQASGRVMGHYRTPGFVLEDNLANEEITVGGERPESPGEGNKQGTDTAPALLAQQQTYTELGWDFEQDWRWDAERGHPVPARAAEGIELAPLPEAELPEQPEEPVDPDAPAEPLPGIDGEGTADSPFQLRSAADLTTVADAINTDNAQYGDKHYVLAANIDVGGATFGGIDEFRGTFDGAGHKIFNITYGPGADSDERALFRRLDGATVTNLTLDGVRTAVTQASQVAGIAINATGGTVIDGNAVINAELSSGHQYVAAIAANAQRGVTVTNNWVQGSFRSARYPAAVVGYARYDVEIRNNLVDAHVTAGGARAHGGMLLAYQGAYNENAPGRISENVLLDGAVDWRGSGTVDTGRVLGIFRDEGFVVENNLANETITVGGERPEAPGPGNRNGADTTPEALAQQQTYEDLGWDFESQWRWDDALGHPVPHRSFLLGEGTESAPFEVRTPADLELLAARTNAGDRTYLGGKHVELLGDLDFTGREPFEGIDSFDGVLDGRGHTVSGITYGRSESAGSLGLVRELSGTVRNLTLDGVRADGGDQPAAGLAITLAGTADRPARVEVVDLRDVVVTATQADVAGGIAAQATHAVIARNMLDVDVTAAGAAGGVVGTLSDGVEITTNLVEADVTVLTDGGSGTRGVNAGLVGAVPEGGTVTGNVALGGTVDYTGTVDGFAGRIVGYTGHEGWTAEENLANVEITVGGQTVTGPGTRNQHGTDATPAQLADKATYEQLGWDFTDDWRWDPAAGRPLLKYVLPEEYPNRITTTFHGDPATRRAFTWYHSIETDAPAVLLSTDPAFPADDRTLVEATRREARSGETVHQAVATDLEPGTTYHYRVGDSISEVWSRTGTFVTATGDGEDSFTFIDLTDTQAKAATEAALAAGTMRKALAAVPDAEFMVHNGDVVQDGNVEQDWIDMLGAAQDTLLGTTIAPASGNHDMYPDAFVDHFMLEHPNEQDTTTGAYYSFTYNGAHVMVLNTNEDEEQAVSDAQLAWLEQDARAAREAGADWLILTMHKGLYTAGNHADDADIIAMREVLVPLVDELEIDLVLQGHDHYMSRTQVLEHDPDGVEGAAVVETTTITEVVDGRRFEYHIDPEGTIYFMPNTAGAKHYQQIGSTDAFDLEGYLQLFDRLGTPRAGNVETFSAVDVSPDRLTVETYQIRDGGAPTRVEGFGIDRQVSPVDELIAALPAPADVTAEDAPAVAAARAAVDALGREQQAALAGLDTLRTIEQRLREVAGLVVTDGSVVGWADPEATSRQAITVRNDTRRDFTDAPVRLTIEDTPAVTAEELTLTSDDGAPLSHEVEHWAPGETSTVWVRLPHVAAESTTSLWAYYGGGNPGNDPADVWRGGYALVEHLAQDTASGEQRVDSTGQHTATLVGADLTAAPTAQGTLASDFAGSRLQYPGDVGGGFGTITVSAIYSFTEEDVAAQQGEGAVVAKQRDGADAAFLLGVGPDGSVRAYRGGATPTVEVPADGEPHLVTHLYDGMTTSVFVDGVEQYQGMNERQQVASDHGVLTTIGGLDTGGSALAGSFHGTIDEVQVASFGFLPEFETFRYATYTGDAVAYGPQMTRGEEPLALVVGGPADGSEVEAGPVTITGALSERAVVTASVAGAEVLSETVDAGSLALEVPVHATGEQTVTLTATAVADSSRVAQAAVVLDVSDTVAPQRPEVEDDSADAEPGTTAVTLTATPRTEQAERLEATFYANEAAAVGENVVVRTGATEDRVPAALTPESGEESGELLPTTVGEDANPFQIYAVTLTEEQAAEEEFHLGWTGTGDDRRVSAWVWDHGAQEWLLKDSDHSAEGEAVALDVTARAEEGAVGPDGTLHLLVWRGLVEEPWGADRVYEQYPDGADFDWAFNHVPDTQLYAEATPWMMIDIFEHLVSIADERKTELVLHAGDWVNREYLDDEYQWSETIRSAELLEEAGLPFMVSWGNHDYSPQRNGRLMLQKYFPMSRFEQSVEGTPFEFGGSHDIDNYFYTAELEGAKLLFLAVGFWSAEDDDAPGLAWAQEVIESHPDHTIILATHHHLVARFPDAPFANPRIDEKLVDPYPNVVLTLSGHNSGSFVTARETDHGTQSYGILTDYQTRPWGGHEFYKNISVDAENGLLYVNTYSPWLDRWISDGRWHSPISADDVPGFHGDDSENFVLELDLGGVQTRTLDAAGLTLAVGAPERVGEPQPVVGAEPVSVVLDGIEPGVTHEWFVELADDGGNVVRSVTSQFALAAAEEPTDPEEPGEPTDPEEPTDPGEPGEPGDPSDPEEPGEPTDPADRTAQFHLSNTWRGTTDVVFVYGRMADEVLVGDWDGDGRDTIAVRRGNEFHVSNAQRGGEPDAVFRYGRADDVILVGDWDGDGADTFAVRRGAEYHVKNALRGGDADVVFHYGREDDTVLVGDWDGNGTDTLAVRRGKEYHVRNTVTAGDADRVFRYGRADDVTLAGDWDGDGTDTLAVQRGRTYHVKNSLRGGDADTVVTYGRLGDEVLVGDWDGNGTDTLAVRRPLGGATAKEVRGLAKLG